MTETEETKQQDTNASKLENEVKLEEEQSNPKTTAESSSNVNEKPCEEPAQKESEELVEKPHEENTEVENVDAASKIERDREMKGKIGEGNDEDKHKGDPKTNGKKDGNAKDVNPSKRKTNPRERKKKSQEEA